MTEATFQTPPVADTIRRLILDRLQQVEQDYGVRILFAAESGSRAWGFWSPDSDYDVRFVFVRSIPDYLQLNPPRDTIELPFEDELDIVGWDIRKAMGLLVKSNATLLEWLDSPIRYLERDDFALRMMKLAEAIVDPVRLQHHYLGLARSNFAKFESEEEVKIKRYFYVLRPLSALRWLRHNGSLPPMAWSALVDGATFEPDLRREFDRLLQAKLGAVEGALQPRSKVLDAFVEFELKAGIDLAQSSPSPASSKALANQTLLELLGI